MRADIWISATAENTYAVVSDLGRSGDTVGAVFRGNNLRREGRGRLGAADPRGVWHIECKVLAAEPGHTFQWMMLTQARDDQESVWDSTSSPLRVAAG